jgi:hypothetical protein
VSAEDIQGNPDLNRYRGDLNLIKRPTGRLAIVAADSEVTISGMARPTGALLPVETVKSFHDFQRADINHLMWCDWDQIVRFSAVPEVQQYVIKPMAERRKSFSERVKVTQTRV